MTTLLYILTATFLVSLTSLLTLFTLAIKESYLQRLLLFLISLSAGGLLGGAFGHLLPEALAKLAVSAVCNTVLISFVFFFLVEKLLHWHHCHHGTEKRRTFGYMNLIGDGLHNFIDGLIIAAAFIIDFNLGVTTTLAVALHEVPHEIGDFGVLLHAGFSRTQALAANFFVAAIAIVGGLTGYLFSFTFSRLLPYLLPFAAGGFLYVAASDLMPEIRQEESFSKSLLLFSVFVFGILILFLAKLFLPE
jgi:zinc and cadmium transporter